MGAEVKQYFLYPLLLREGRKEEQIRAELNILWGFCHINLSRKDVFDTCSYPSYAAWIHNLFQYPCPKSKKHLLADPENFNHYNHQAIWHSGSIVKGFFYLSDIFVYSVKLAFYINIAHNILIIIIINSLFSSISPSLIKVFLIISAWLMAFILEKAPIHTHVFE